MIIVSKSLSGGYVPIAAVLMRKAIYDKVFSSLDRSVVHSSTFGKSNFAMTAGLATLSVLDDEDLMANATRMGDLLGERLSALAGKYEFIHDVRWRGLMLAIEFGQPEIAEAQDRLDNCQQAQRRSVLPGHHNPAAAGPWHPDPGCRQPHDNHQADPATDHYRGRRRLVRDAFDKVMAICTASPDPAWESLMRIAKNAMPRGRGKSRAAAE